MISGLNSSSLSLALRTAQRAEQTVAKTTQQIATGKKVASVKDDGAAYVRAESMKSQLAQIDGREILVDMINVVISNQAAQDEQTNIANHQMQDIILRAIDYPAGSNQRANLNSEYQQAYQTWLNARAPAGPIASLNAIPTGGWGVMGTSQDEMLSSLGIWNSLGSTWGDFGHQNTNWAGNGVPISAIDILNGSVSNLKNGLASVRFHNERVIPGHQKAGGNTSHIDTISKVSNQQRDRIETTISSLTDADMGKASRENELAQTRQQLAYQTVRNAITQYGNMASGLLGNVQGTQRNILA